MSDESDSDFEKSESHFHSIALKKQAIRTKNQRAKSQPCAGYFALGRFWKIGWIHPFFQSSWCNSSYCSNRPIVPVPLWLEEHVPPLHHSLDVLEHGQGLGRIEAHHLDEKYSSLARQCQEIFKHKFQWANILFWAALAQAPGKTNCNFELRRKLIINKILLEYYLSLYIECNS